MLLYTRLYTHVCHKIYDKICPKKLDGDLSPGHYIKKFFPATKMLNFQCTTSAALQR